MAMFLPSHCFNFMPSTTCDAEDKASCVRIPQPHLPFKLLMHTLIDWSYCSGQPYWIRRQHGLSVVLLTVIIWTMHQVPFKYTQTQHTLRTPCVQYLTQINWESNQQIIHSSITITVTGVTEVTRTQQQIASFTPLSRRPGKEGCLRHLGLNIILLTDKGR